MERRNVRLVILQTIFILQKFTAHLDRAFHPLCTARTYDLDSTLGVLPTSSDSRFLGGQESRHSSATSIFESSDAHKLDS